MHSEPVRLQRVESDTGVFEMATRRPAPELRPYAFQYQGYYERSTVPVKRREVPLPGVVLIFGFEGKFRVTDPRAGSEGLDFSCFVAGPHDSFVFTESIGATGGMQVNLTPIGAYQFFGLPISEIANRSLDLGDVFGADGRLLAERLRSACDWQTRFQLLDLAILKRLACAPTPSLGVTHAWRRMRDTHGLVDIGALAEEVGWSRKHLASQFGAQVGLAPKVMARVLRFNRAISLLKETETASDWSGIAFDCGYYDQSHLIREFRDFAGQTPTEFARSLSDHGSIES
jgi:AraC-like DNA-binding protein